MLQSIAKRRTFCVHPLKQTIKLATNVWKNVICLLYQTAGLYLTDLLFGKSNFTNTARNIDIWTTIRSQTYFSDVFIINFRDA